MGYIGTKLFFSKSYLAAILVLQSMQTLKACKTILYLLHGSSVCTCRKLNSFSLKHLTTISALPWWHGRKLNHSFLKYLVLELLFWHHPGCNGDLLFYHSSFLGFVSFFITLVVGAHFGPFTPALTKISQILRRLWAPPNRSIRSCCCFPWWWIKSLPLIYLTQL